jgi:hypothetical protein
VRPITILLAAVLAANAGETIQYKLLDRAVIENRLRSAPTTDAKRERALHDFFVAAGCPADGLQELPVKHAREPNVICSVPGKSDAIILVSAHFDFAKRGSGVIDNWSGAALLPSLLESINKIPRRHQFIFVSFADEENGMVGSKAYVRSLSAQQLHKISAVINLDSLAAGPTKVELDRGDKRLVLALDSVSKTLDLPLAIVNVHKVGRSDSDTFQDAGVPTVLIHSITQETLPVLHSIRDNVRAVKMDDYYDTYKLLAAYLAYLDGKLDPESPSVPATK